VPASQLQAWMAWMVLVALVAKMMGLDVRRHPQRSHQHHQHHRQRGGGWKKRSQDLFRTLQPRVKPALCAG
jgi:hypothetical protein